MDDWFTNGVGVLIGLAISLLALGVLLSIPWFVVQVIRVGVRRDGIPVTYVLRSLVRRRSAMLATFVGLALVIFAFAAMLMLAEGIEHTLVSTADPRNVKVMYENSPAEWNSELTVEEVKRLSAVAEVAKRADGSPLISPEIVVLTWLPRPNATDPDDGANVTVRGLGIIGFDVHSARSLKGRAFHAGTHEIVIGRALQGRFSGAELGGTMSFSGRDWQVVGIADHRGNAYDSEIWGDVDVLGPAFRRSYTSVSLTLTDANAFERLQSAFAVAPEFNELEAQRERDFWKGLSGHYVEFVTLLGSAIGLIFAFAAILGAMNTMYAQVAARTRELGALRAIGFKSRAVLIALVFESMLMSLIAGVVGISCAALLLGVRFRLTTSETSSEISYQFHSSIGVTVVCLVVAMLMGYLGGLLPALRAQSIPIVKAVRAD
jgi:putative ABC transport system permease protein